MLLYVFHIVSTYTTQYEEECYGLFYNSCQHKLLVLPASNSFNGVYIQCNQFLAHLYQQDSIIHTTC